MVSDAPARCPNCQAPIRSAFCGDCGQETLAPTRSLGALCHELLGSLFAFDGRVWRSLGPLFIRPGFLTRAWIEGRRMSFVPPLRLFLFFSILLFLVVQCKTPTTDLLVRKPAAVPAAEAATGVSEDFHLDLDLPGYWPFSVLNRWLLEQEQKLQHMAPESRNYVLVRRAMELAPIGLLLLLPLLALFLKLWWLGTGAYYIDHLVLLMHAYAFLCGLAVFLVLVPLPDLLLVLAPCALVPFYFHRAMRRVHGRSFWRSFFGTFAGGAVTLAAVILVTMILVPYALLTV